MLFGLVSRHYVVSSIMAGDDVKTIQQNAGHYSSAFTLDRYAHVTATMQKESANRMSIPREIAQHDRSN